MLNLKHISIYKSQRTPIVFIALKVIIAFIMQVMNT